MGKGSRIVHCDGSYITTPTSFDLRQGKFLTLHVNAPRKIQHTRWISNKRWLLFLTSCDKGGQPETQTHTHFFTHFYETRIVTESEHRQSKSRHSFARTRRKHGVLRAERGEEGI